MTFRSVLLFAFSVLIAAAQPEPTVDQGTKPHPKPTQYPVHAAVGKIVIGAENWGHGFTSPLGSYSADDFIVIEVALYAEGNVPFDYSPQNFTLRLNKKGTPLLTESPGAVAASIKYPDWEQRRELNGQVGAGDMDVILGRQRPVERFPGDPRTTQGQPAGGPLPRAPQPEDASGVKVQKPTIDQVVARVALAGGVAHPPIAGFLFFPYKGKMKALKTVELIYEGPAGSASLVLP